MKPACEVCHLGVNRSLKVKRCHLPSKHLRPALWKLEWLVTHFISLRCCYQNQQDRTKQGQRKQGSTFWQKYQCPSRCPTAFKLSWLLVEFVSADRLPQTKTHALNIFLLYKVQYRQSLVQSSSLSPFKCVSNTCTWTSGSLDFSCSETQEAFLLAEYLNTIKAHLYPYLLKCWLPRPYLITCDWLKGFYCLWLWIWTWIQNES